MIKLTKEQVEAIPVKLGVISQKELAVEYGVHWATISYWVKQLKERGFTIPKGKTGKPCLLGNVNKDVIQTDIEMASDTRI